MKLSEADALFVGGVAVDRIYNGTDVAWQSGPADPLAGALVADDFRTMTEWPAAWTDPYNSATYLTDFIFDGTGAVNPGLAGATGVRNASTSTDIYYFRDIPDGVDFWQMTCVFHVYFPSPAPFDDVDYGQGPWTLWWSDLEFTVIHDPSNNYDAERWTTFDAARKSDIARPPQADTYAYDANIDYNYGAVYLKGATDYTALEDVEAVMTSWADATGFHVRVAFDDAQRFEINLPPAITPPPSHTTLNQLLLRAYFTGTGPDAQPSPWTLKGVYVLDHPIDETVAEEIATHLLP